MSDNIKVVVKVRPLISREIEEKLSYQWRVKNNTLYQIDQNGKDAQAFTFDKVYNQNTNTTDVYNDIAKPIVEAATAGFNGTIFAYGQTSSGKTYTMTGTEESPGIIPLAVINLFDIIKNIPDRDFLISVSYVEIYNETLIDLLNPEKRNIKIHDTLQGVKVDATEKVTTSPEEVLQFMKEGQANRQTGSTFMNEESSRSHSIFQIKIESREHIEGEEEVGCLNVSQLNLVDLAGSERAGQTGATGLRFKEGTHINKSLSSLALVIKQLSEGLNKHVNYRDSKLTRILQNSLGGNAKTGIICAVTPAAVEETISTLQFAYRAKAIKNNPEVNVVASDASMIDSLTKQLSSLKTQLESKRNVEEDNNKLQKQIAALQKFLSGFGQRSGVDLVSKRKNQQLRRATISTPHLIQDVASVPRFCTPSLKYNPMALGSSTEFLPIMGISTLSSVPEEPSRLVTPPPQEAKILLNDEIIQLDSDDDVPTEMVACSPYHKCYGSSKTPPCVLRKNALEAEKNLKDLEELTKREKMYPHNVVELIEKLEKTTTVVNNLEEKVIALTQLSEEKELEIEKLKHKIKQVEEEVRSVTSAKVQAEECCKKYSVKLTDWEVSYDTLKKKANNREKELLSRLEEFACNKNGDDLKEQLKVKDKTILDLENNLQIQNRNTECLEKKTYDFESLIDSYKQKLQDIESENALYKLNIESLNTTIASQECNLETATNDIQSYVNIIQELKIELANKENSLKLSISENDIENMIINQEKFIANNENISNIIQSLKIAVDKKNKEIELLKSVHESELKNRVELEISNVIKERENTILQLTKDVQLLNQHLEGKESEMQKLIEENNNLLSSQNELNKQIFDIQESVNDLNAQIKSHEKEITNLQEINKELSNTIAEKKIMEEKLLAQNKELLFLIEGHINDITNLKDVIKHKEVDISLHTEYLGKVSELNHKIEKLLVSLKAKVKEGSESTDNFVNVLKTLDENINILQESIMLLVTQSTIISSQKFEMSNLILNILKQYFTEITSICNEMSNNTALNSVHEKCDTENLQCEYEQITDFEDPALQYLLKEMKLLYDSLRKRVLNMKQILHEQNNKTFETKQEFMTMEIEIKQQVETLLKEKTIILIEKDKVLNNVLVKATSLCHKLNLENKLTSGSEDNYDDRILTDVGEQIILILDKIASQIEFIKSECYIDNANKKKELSELKKEVIIIKEQNLKLCDDMTIAETRNQNLSRDLHNLQNNNKDLSDDLIASRNLLNSLQKELQTKTKELDIMKTRIQEWNHQFQEFENSRQNNEHKMQKEISKLKEQNIQYELMLLNKNSPKRSEKKSCNSTQNNLFDELLKKDESFIIHTPQSLLTICCNKIIKLVQQNENTSENEVNYCECDKLMVELTELRKENSKLTITLQEQQVANETLLKAHEEIRKEIELLLNYSSELQKKIVNHRTNLSTLTATTYAENKSLSSQVKFLQHHHSRFHNVCQKDLTEFKNQLHELIKLLQERGFETNFKTNFKGFSLPNPINSCSMMTNETLDCDLLMLDTNVTLTTSANTTLIGHDQIYLDGTHACLNTEVACQTVDNYPINNPILSLTCSKEEHVLETIKTLEEENQNLKKVIERLKTQNVFTSNEVSAQTSPTKEHSANQPLIETVMCKNCILEKELQEQFAEEIKNISQKFNDISNQKDIIEDKYNKLSLEMLSTEALVRKLHNFEKELNNKGKEIDKLTNNLKTTKALLDSVQKENIDLSNQVMESISEADDLKKDLDDIKEVNSKLTKKCTMIEHEQESNKLELKCDECLIKDKTIKDLQNKYSNSHTRLSRSYSDSDSSSRYNKICTLQNELDAGREDCNELKEEVTTIKNQLQCSNLSLTEAMELDESIAESNVIDSQVNNCNMPIIPEEHVADIYTVDKKDCFKYYLEKTGDEKLHLQPNMKIIDIIKMLHNYLITRHGNEIENLVNKLRDCEDCKSELQSQLTYVNKNFEENNLILQNIDKKMTSIRINIETLNKNDGELENLKVMNNFKENFLAILDNEFSLNTINTFELIVNNAINENTTKLNDTLNEYKKLQENLKSMTEELESVNNKLQQIKSQLLDKENDCNLLTAQNMKIHEINNALTIDIVRRESEFSQILNSGFQKLSEHGILSLNDLDFTLPADTKLNLLLEHIITENKSNNVTELKKQNDDAISQITNLKAKLQIKNKEFETLKDEFEDNNRNLYSTQQKLKMQKDIYEDLNVLYKSKVEENNANIVLNQKVTEETNILKQAITSKETMLQNLNKELDRLTLKNSEYECKISEFLRTTQEIDNLKSMNLTITKEKESLALDLEKAGKTIKENKCDLEKMTSEILILKQFIDENNTTVQNYKSETENLLKENIQLKEQLTEKYRDLSRLETNIKTHEKTATIQSKLISRLQNQKEEDNKTIRMKEQQMNELVHKYDILQNEHTKLNESMATLKEEFNVLSNLKISLEERISQLEMEVESDRKARLSVEGKSDALRRRRQSIHDSKRVFEGKHDENKIEEVNAANLKTDDFFMDVDDNSSSRSSPVRLSKGRDSLQSKHDESEEDHPSRPSSVIAVRRRRQSSHDLHRSVLVSTPEQQDHSGNKSKDEQKFDTSNSSDASIVKELRDRLSCCQQELDELKDKYRELDDECETCAQYLREREDQCGRLKKEKTALEKMINDLNDKLQSAHSNTSRTNNKVNYAHVAVNTDEDWANLHAVVVDRMSFDLEVEKNKKLAKTIEELLINKQQLKLTVAKMQKSLENHSSENSSKDNTKDLKMTKKELHLCKQELEDLKKRYKELDEECDTCSKYLREQEEKCRKLKEIKATLEAKLQELQADVGTTQVSVRKKRQTLHDQNRDTGTEKTDKATSTSDDFQSYQVERDNPHPIVGEAQTKKNELLKMAVERLSQQKYALEQQLLAAQTQAALTVPQYIATGSAIVQNQQITDVMKENRKLKKMNAKLINICKKRGKPLLQDTNQENQDPADEDNIDSLTT